MAMVDSRRKQKKSATRERIVEQAFMLFIEKGFEEVTVDEIAKAAEISRRTFFRYFPGKEAVVFPTHEEKLDLLNQWLEEFGNTQPSLQAVQSALMEMAKYFESTRQHVMQQQLIISNSQSLARYENQIDLDWVNCIGDFIVKSANESSEQQLFDAFNAKILAAALIGGIRVAYQQWINGGCKTGEFQQFGVDVFGVLKRF